MYLIVDGSTSGPTSSDLAREFIRDVIDWYVAADVAATAESLTAQLRRTHLDLSRRFPRDSASYMLTCIAGTGTALVLHAGDCLLGRQTGGGPIHWLIKPHTLANATCDMPIDEIAGSHVRHRLTRSFRPREFMPPDVSEIKTELGSALIAATDGFWAELGAEEQVMFMQGHDVPMTDEGDDRSFLQIRCLDEPGATIQLGESASANVYARLDER